MHNLKLISVLILLATLDVCKVAAQDARARAEASNRRVGSGAPDTAATFRARRDRAMQAAPDALVLVRSRSTVMAENENGFRQNATFYYLTGLENALGALLVMDSRRQESWLFVPAPGQLPRIGSRMHPPYGYVEPGQAKSLGLDHVAFWDEFASFVDRRLAADPRLVIRAPSLSDGISTTPEALTGQDALKLWNSVLKARWPHAKFGPMPDPVALRTIKEANEVAALRRVAVSSSAALRAGLAGLRPGRRQREAEVDVIAMCVRAGAEGISFWPWLMTGNNSDIETAFQSLADSRFLDRTMRAGELARVDVGCSQDHYQGDVGRTAPVSGRFDHGQREAWDVFVSAYRAGLAAIRPGNTDNDVFVAWQREFRRRRSQLRTSFGRRTAEVALLAERPPFWQMHGVGLQSAEGSIDKITVGQVLAFEPMLTVDGVGLYLEDMILVTAAGAEVLTKGLPYSSFEIEAVMRSGKRF